MTQICLDTRGLLCPLPVIRLQDRVRDLPPGTRVELLSSDPGALIDIPAWCRMSGHRWVESQALEHAYRILVETGAR